MQHLQRRTHELSQWMMHARTLAVAEKGNLIILQHQLQHFLIGIAIAQQYSNIPPMPALFAAKTQHIRSSRFGLKPPCGCLDKLNPGRLGRGLLRKTKELLLDIFQSPRLETMRCRQTADAAFLPQFSGQQLQLLKGPVGTMENTRFTAIFLRAVSRIQRQRDMDMVRLLQQCSQDLLFLWIEKNESVYPDFRPGNKRCLRQPRCQFIQKIAGIIVAASHACGKAIIEQRQILQLILQTGITDLLCRRGKTLRYDAVALEFIHGLSQRGTKAALPRCPLKKTQLVLLCLQHTLQKQPAPDFRDTRLGGTTNIQQDLLGKAAKPEYLGPQKTAALRLHCRSELALDLIGHVLRQ